MPLWKCTVHAAILEPPPQIVCNCNQMMAAILDSPALLGWCRDTNGKLVQGQIVGEEGKQQGSFWVGNMRRWFGAATPRSTPRLVAHSISLTPLILELV